MPPRSFQGACGVKPGSGEKSSHISVACPSPDLDQRDGRPAVTNSGAAAAIGAISGKPVRPAIERQSRLEAGDLRHQPSIAAASI